MGSNELHKKYEDKLVVQISEHFLFHMARNEAKRTKNFNEVIANLNKQMTTFAKTNAEQRDTIASLIEKIQLIEGASAKQREILEKKIKCLEDDIQRKGQVSTENIKP